MPPWKKQRKVVSVSRKVVPWMSRYEWDEVKNNLFSSDIDNIKKGLNRIAVWKSRYHRIPSGIDATATIALAVVMDMQSNSSEESHFESDNVVLLYGMALVRFINLLTEIGQVKKHVTPIHVIAERMGIPEWLVDLRHQVTHSSCPSLSVLRYATYVALQWLEKNFWKSESKNMISEARNGASKNYQTDVNASRTLLKTYQEMYSKGKASEEEMMMKSEEFHKLLLQCNKIIDVFVEEVFIFNKDSRFGDVKWSSFLKMWDPFLNVFISTEKVTALHEAMIFKFGMKDGQQSQLLIKWFVKLLTVKKPKKSEEKHLSVYRFFKKLQTLCNWKILLKAVLETPCEYSLQIIPLITKKANGILHEKQQALLMELMTLYCAEHIPFNKDAISVHDYHSISNIEDELAKESSTQKKWNLCRDLVEWSNYPIGLLPHQVGAEVLNLDLPVEVDSLHKERTRGGNALISPSPQPPSCQNRGGLESDCESEGEEAYPEPDMETRLLVVKHTKRSGRWPRKRLLDIINDVRLL